METTAFYIYIVAAITAAVGWVWFLLNAFRHGWLWGLGALLFPPVALVYIPLRWSRYGGPSALFLLAGLLVGEAIGLAHYDRVTAGRRSVEIGARGGSVHLILTKQVGVDYPAKLSGRSDLVGLQMANPEVNDDTLLLLAGMTRLRELDLNDTAITDRGLEVLAKLPALESLRLRRTAITDAGLRAHLMGHPKLKRLELTGTKVKGQTKREWKKVEGRELLD